MSAITPKKESIEEDLIEFTVSRKDMWKYFAYTAKLEKIFDQQKLIGAKSIYTKLMNVFVLKEDVEDNRSSERFFELSGKVIPRFIKDKAYNFEVKKRVKNERYEQDKDYIDVETGKLPPKTIIKTYSSQDMITNAISSAVKVLLDETKEEKKDKKEQIIKACYKTIENYISKEKELQEIISHYKATVISGYIAIQCGFTLSADLKPINIKDVPPTNEQIYNAVKYFTDPLNPATKKKKAK